MVVDSIEEAVDARRASIAPEHLCLLVRDAAAVAKTVRNAGGIFVGDDAPESLGDYTAGPEPRHADVGRGPLRLAARRARLPEGDERRRRRCGAAARGGAGGRAIARAEGFTAHARSIELRLQDGEASTDGGAK